MKFLQILIGAPFVFIGTAVLSGGIDFAVMIILGSIVCTAGVGLIIWLPLCLIVGKVTMALVGSFVKEPAVKRFRFGWDEVALTEFLRKAKARGISSEEVDRTLRRNGWSEELIQRVRQSDY